MLACQISSTSASISCKLKISRLDVCRSSGSFSSFFLSLFSLDQGRKDGPDRTGSVSCADFLGLSRIPGVIRLTSFGSLDEDEGVCSLSFPHKNDFPVLPDKIHHRMPWNQSSKCAPISYDGAFSILWRCGDFVCTFVS